MRDGLEFVSKEQPSEQLTVAAMSEEDQNTVNRRLAIGIAMTFGFIEIGLIPDRPSVGSRRSRCFFTWYPWREVERFYETAKELAEDGEFEALLSNVKSVLKEPNTIKKNLLTACAFLSGREQDEVKSWR